MLELIAEICLKDQPSVCARRLLPGAEACEPARAADWAAQRPALVLVGATCAPLAEAEKPLPMREIAPGVFVHQARIGLVDATAGADIANVGFVVGAEAVAVIDAGNARSVGEALYAAVRRETDLPIRWLILTHMHPDHVFGASVFREAGAMVVGHAKLPAALAARAESYAAALARDAGPAAAIGSDIVLPEMTVATTTDIDLGGRTLRLEAHPTAHTDNDLTVLDLETETLWAGDLVFDQHLPVIDGSALGWIRTLDRLKAVPAARVIPGHGRITLGWPAAALPVEAYLEALVAETRAALAAGVSIAEATPRLGADLRGDWLLFDAFNGRNATTVYRELEWE